MDALAAYPDFGRPYDCAPLRQIRNGAHSGREPQ
jgi:hypothetical protein